MKTVIIMVGIPGSGKSTWVQKDLVNQKESYIVLNADTIRKELYGDEAIQGNPKTVFQILYDKFRRAILNKDIKTIYIDNTSVDAKSRKQIFEILEKNCPECKIKIKVFDDFEKAKKQNKERSRVVPDDVMNKMINKFKYPEKTETSLNFEII